MKNQIKLILGIAAAVAIQSSVAYGQFPAAYDELSQVVPTTAGDTYQVSFSLGAEADSYLRSYFGGVGGTLGLELDNAGYFDWTQFTFNAVATGNSTELDFFGNNIPSWLNLANVSVVDVTGGGNLVANGNMSQVDGDGVPTDWTLTTAALGSDTGLNIDTGDFSAIPGGDGANTWSFGDVADPVGTVPDSGSTMAMMSFGLVGLGGIARRFRR